MASDLENQAPALTGPANPAEADTATETKPQSKSADTKPAEAPAEAQRDARGPEAKPDGKPAQAKAAEPRQGDQRPQDRNRRGGQHSAAQREQQQKNGTPTLDLAELKEMSIQRLNQVAKDMGVSGAAGLRKQELIFKILQVQA